MGGALWKEFHLNILSKLWCSSKFFPNNCVDMDSIPWEKAKLSEFGKKLSKWEQYEENLFSFKLPSEKFLAIGKNRTACLIKTIPLFLLREHTTVFYWMEWKRNVFSILMEGCHAVVGARTEENGGSKLTEGFCFSSSQGFIPLQSKFFLIIILIWFFSLNTFRFCLKPEVFEYFHHHLFSRWRR